MYVCGHKVELVNNVMRLTLLSVAQNNGEITSCIQGPLHLLRHLFLNETVTILDVNHSNDLIIRDSTNQHYYAKLIEIT